MTSKLLALLLPVTLSFPAMAAPPARPGGNVPGTPSLHTGEVGTRQPLPSSTDTTTGEDGYVIVKGQVFQITKGHAVLVREEVAVKIAQTEMAVKVSPKGITGIDGKPFEVPPRGNALDRRSTRPTADRCRGTALGRSQSPRASRATSNACSPCR